MEPSTRDGKSATLSLRVCGDNTSIMSLSKTLGVNNIYLNGSGNVTGLEKNILSAINNGDKRLFNFKLDANATKSKLIA